MSGALDSTSNALPAGVSWTQSLSGTRAVQTFQGDTIERLALRELGDAAQWYTLVQLNALTWPYITDTAARAGNGVLLAGRDTLKVPAPAPAVSGVADPTDVYGTDVALVDGLLQISPSGDFLTVAGPANLDQALLNRLTVPVNNLVYHPTYGTQLYTLLGLGNGGQIGTLGGIYAQRSVLQDPRIDSVQSMTVTITGDSIAIDGVVVAVNGKLLPVGTTLNGASS